MVKQGHAHQDLTLGGAGPAASGAKHSWVVDRAAVCVCARMHFRCLLLNMKQIPRDLCYFHLL